MSMCVAFPFLVAVVYWLAQFLGGILGALFIALAFGWTTAAQGPGLGATNFGGAINLYGRAGAATNIQLPIMFPMIATLEEARRLHTIYASVKHELESGGVTLLPNTQIGIMVETPAAALMADVPACEVDFFSIGANDLFQCAIVPSPTIPI